jgi:hypothetical protein
VIPWFKQSYTGPGQSVCRHRWIAIRKGNRLCYAQWEDCGPFRTDHFQYVFGNERPKLNAAHGAGLSVSPAIRDYLGLAPTDVTDWQFVEVRDVPPGPWRSYGITITSSLRVVKASSGWRWTPAAIRKDHSEPVPSIRRGDASQIILSQVKRGSCRNINGLMADDAAVISASIPARFTAHGDPLRVVLQNPTHAQYSCPVLPRLKTETHNVLKRIAPDGGNDFAR